MIHLTNNGYLPKDASTLLGNARYLCSGMDVVVRDTRVSSKYLEFDISADKANLQKILDNLFQIGDIDHAKQVVEEKKDKEDAIREGIMFFNSERFWECHEVLEGVWKNCDGEEKTLVQGIILVAAALVHYQKDQDKICLSVFERALKKLKNASGIYHNINIDNLKNNVKQICASEKIATFAI
jgi:uncharacterized protein